MGAGRYERSEFGGLRRRQNGGVRAHLGVEAAAVEGRDYPRLWTLLLGHVSILMRVSALEEIAQGPFMVANELPLLLRRTIREVQEDGVRDEGRQHKRHQYPNYYILV